MTEIARKQDRLGWLPAGVLALSFALISSSAFALSPSHTDHEMAQKDADSAQILSTLGRSKRAHSDLSHSNGVSGRHTAGYAPVNEDSFKVVLRPAHKAPRTTAGEASHKAARKSTRTNARQSKRTKSHQAIRTSAHKAPSKASHKRPVKSAAAKRLTKPSKNHRLARVTVHKVHKAHKSLRLAERSRLRASAKTATTKR